MEDGSDSVPVVMCTLSTRAWAAQKLEWADLAELALSRNHVEGGIASTYPLDLAEQIEDLAARERSCCGSWLNISHERTTDVFHLQLTTINPDGVELIRSF